MASSAGDTKSTIVTQSNSDQPQNSGDERKNNDTVNKIAYVYSEAYLMLCDMLPKVPKRVSGR